MGSKLDFGPIYEKTQALVGFDYVITTGQLLNPRGATLAFADNAGAIRLALSADTTLFGWINCQKSFAFGSTDYTNGYATTTAGQKLRVFPFAANPGMVLKLPTYLGVTSTGLSVQARIGEECDIVGVNDGTVSYVVPGTQSTDVLLFVGLSPDGDTDAALFCVNPAKIQVNN